MGCQKITYYNEGKPLETFRKNLKVVYAKSGFTEKKALNYSTFGSLMPGRYTGGNQYRYSYQGSEKDDEITGVEGSHYTTYFREIDTRLGRMWSVDPVFQPWQSSYNSMDNNPILYNDPLGNTVKPTTEGAKKETEKYGEKTYTNKKGKVKENKNYEPAFGEMYEKWKNDPNILVNFTTIEGEDYGGTISYEGENEEGQKVYNVLWDPSQTKQLGASGIFEESYHLYEALEGKELSFDMPGNGTPGLDIYDEVRAKQWVVNNVKSFKEDYRLGGDYYGYTHYGYIKKLDDVEVIKLTLMNGAPSLSPKFKGAPGGGTSVGGTYIQSYTPSNFGGRYSSFSPTPKKP